MIKGLVKDLEMLYCTKDPFQLCDCLNIKIIRTDLGSEIKGFFQKTPSGVKIIHLNTNLSVEDEKYVCSHELGHALLHPDISILIFLKNKLQVKNKYEIESDIFAAELLLSDNLDKTDYFNMTIHQVASKLCVPYKLVEYKFNST